MPKLRLVLDTQRSNARFKAYDPDVVLTPLEQAASLVDAFHQQKAEIDSDRHLTPEGKAAARIKAGNATLAAIKAWHEPRLKGIDRDLLSQRAALIPTTEKPDSRRIEFMAAELLKFTPKDRSVFYNSATEDERRVMEAASASVGRVPTKTANGLEWKTLLDPDMVNEAIVARLDPAAAAKVRELTEIREIQITVAGVAAGEVREALNEYRLD
jgi:hypothetical protein